MATYSGILDDLRRVSAATDLACARGLNASDFSYNTGSLRCPRCEGTGQISLDVQFLPDVDIPCPDCDGTRYAPDAHDIRRPTPNHADDRMRVSRSWVWAAMISQVYRSAACGSRRCGVVQPRV